ncbi:GNAT family N-acetyltransferase [Ancylomarina sp. 16SWW S1-10-2]|uniref:GNAT family N-acetyltransferase n=1 Tax=Ancylomarina sp. 16SWW S1-10-2 TaxID=2499681 RepID=UPI0012AEA670|nr:GNAT family N-acetyltransferase [Ancylomarina sp. 16SWW S1-10-2]MRT93420.1 GNAT family N-acetyltransferase [Ancylomarina sp. 16SWW S1-10-2]
MKILYVKKEADYQAWLNIWKGWNGKEIFAHPDYLNLFDDYSEALCAVLSRGDLMVIYPFCLRSLSVEFNENHDYKKCKDIISPYGYGGLYLIGEGDFNSILDEFYSKFEKWAISQNVISEFIRFDLYSKSREKFNGEVSHNNENIVCDLRKGKDQLWKEFKPKVRNNVRKAVKNDLSLVLDLDGKQIEAFLDIYYGTMDRLMANEKYYFKREFFERIHDKLKGHFVYFYAKKGNQILSVDLVLISDHKIYSFLSATDRDSFQYRPNDFVKYNIIQWGIDNNKSYYVLGGGHKLLDSLFSYKKAFAPEGVVPFYVGKKIYNPKLYCQLVELKEKKLLENFDVLNRDSEFFPLYRMQS